MSSGAVPTPFLPALRAVAGEGVIRHVHHEAPRAERFGSWPSWVAPPVLAALTGGGVQAPWSHQCEAMELAHAGRHVVLGTGTASGKSLAYLVPVLTEILQAPPSLSGRTATALYLSPTKALAADQLASIAALAVPGIRAAAYDGDTMTEERRWIRRHAGLVLTNPDLLHHSLLPGHEHWAGFLRALRFVVVDECHTYRGVFGTHVAAVLRRLRRVAARYGATPTFVLASATISDPAGHARSLLGMPVTPVLDDGSPRGARAIVLWEPATGTDGARPAVVDAARVTAALVGAGAQTVAFARSRAGAEWLAVACRERLEVAGRAGAEVAAYRGGFLPDERRALERDLRGGRLRALAATNALELGIDVSGLDAVVLAGWPGRLSSFRQQVGRAGRRGRESVAVLVGEADPFDRYLLHHPAAIFDSPGEPVVLDPDNEHVLLGHLAAAAAEVPLTEADAAVFGPAFAPAVHRLVDGGVLRRRPTGWFWAREGRATDHVPLRGAEGTVSIMDSATGRVVGTLDAAAAQVGAHTGAVHLHQGDSWVVTELDLEGGLASAVRGDPGWSTVARTQSHAAILSGEPGGGCPGGEVLGGEGLGGVGQRPVWGWGALRVVSRVTSFVRIHPEGRVLGRHPLDLPERVLTTEGLWICVTPEVQDAWTSAREGAGCPGGARAVGGALHAIEHLLVALLPLVAGCDRWDIGAFSTLAHPDTGLPTVVIHDNHPGRAGFTRRAHASRAGWLRAAAATVAACDCASGCPGCIQSPRCERDNAPLDKPGALLLLRALDKGASLTEAEVGHPG